MAANNTPAGGDTSSVGSLIAVGFVLILLIILWYLVQPYATKAWLTYIQVEAYAAKATTPIESVQKPASSVIEWAKTAEVKEVDKLKYDGARYVVGRGWHNYLVVLVFLGFAFAIWKKHSTYKGVPNLDQLLSTEHRVWPSLEFVKRFNPYRQWKELEGAGRFMVSPFIYCCENGIIANYTSPKKGERKFLDEKAESVLIESLGKPFTSFSELSMTEQVVITILLAKYTESYKNYNKLNGFFARTLAEVSAPEYVSTLITMTVKPVMELLDGVTPKEKGQKNDKKNVIKDQNIELLLVAVKKEFEAAEKKKQSGTIGVESGLGVLREAKKYHTYVSTMIVGLSRNVKKKGKFPAGRLIFIKPWDRKLFMLLSNSPYYVPRNLAPYRFVSGFSAEVIGVCAHYQHEVYAERALPKPHVQTGIEGLKSHLKKQNLI